MTQQSPAVSFSKQMRIATRDVHKISDALVNAKMVFALSDNKVWAEGLLIFYEIFRFLEENVPNNILPLEYHRREAFENDLNFYLGPSWNKNYKPRESVAKYLKHLQEIKETNPTLLIAYVYHLYMGLLSGGQILQKKRNLISKMNPLKSSELTAENGASLTNFGSHKIYDLKEKMRGLIDDLCKDFDETTKNELIEESRKVFELNNQIVKTVQGVNRVYIQKLAFVAVILSVVFVYFKFVN